MAKKKFTDYFLEAMQQAVDRASGSARMADAAGRNEGAMTGGRRGGRVTAVVADLPAPKDMSEPESVAVDNPPVAEDETHSKAMAAAARWKRRLAQQATTASRAKPATQAPTEPSMSANAALFASPSMDREAMGARFRQKARAGMEPTMAGAVTVPPATVSAVETEFEKKERKRREKMLGKTRMTEA